VFNGDNYSSQWLAEAESRGLSNLKTTVDALPSFTCKKSIDLFTKHCVYTESELNSHQDILLENYCKILHIEALTMLELTKGEIIPACVAYQNELVKLLKRKKEINLNLPSSLEEQLTTELSNLSSTLLKELVALQTAIEESKDIQKHHDLLSQALFYRERVFAAMTELRITADELESLLAKNYRTLPSYGELLFSVN
jgi:glutamine synthetase